MNANTETIAQDYMIINGQRYDYPKDRDGHIIVQGDNGRLFVDGYEWKDGRWKRTLRAILECLLA